VTFQARDADESRHLYDHLAVLSPILLALTAATPVLHGRLADTDVRWATISASVDDRTPAERGEPDTPHAALEPEEIAQLAGGGAVRMPKSRYDSISRYLANCQGCQERYNDVQVRIQ
jgi:glutamate--cysteine ligase catalytic subunit